MSIQQKKISMKSLLPSLALLLFLGSCITSNQVYYNDPNYLSSDEFSTYAEIAANQKKDIEANNTDTANQQSSEYNNDDYYDYSFSSRIRRFHRPLYYSSYYGGMYTDYYWYNNDPFSCGTSIYLGYNWHSPYYYNYTYSPYYYGYYSPYYYGNYYSYYALGHNQYLYGLYNNHYAHNNHNAYITGNRTSLASYNGRRGFNINQKKQNLNIRNNNYKNDKVLNNRKYNLDTKEKTNNTIPNRPELQQQNQNWKNNYNRNNNYKRNNTIKNSNRNNNYQNKRSNSSNRSSRGTSKRGVKPRR